MVRGWSLIIFPYSTACLIYEGYSIVLIILLSTYSACLADAGLYLYSISITTLPLKPHRPRFQTWMLSVTRDALSLVLCMVWLEAPGRVKPGPWGGLMGARGPASIYERWLGPGLHGLGQQFSSTRKAMQRAFFPPHHYILLCYCTFIMYSPSYSHFLTYNRLFFFLIYIQSLLPTTYRQQQRPHP